MRIPTRPAYISKMMIIFDVAQRLGVKLRDSPTVAIADTVSNTTA